MKFAFIIVPIILAFYCRNPDSSIIKSFRLTDLNSLSIAIVTCKLPADFDTTYTWINSSDCACCGGILYRSHSRNYEVVTESGFLSVPHLDSGFYFTIAHAPFIDCDTNTKYFSNKPLSSNERKMSIEKYIKEMAKSGLTSNMSFDTSRIINKNKFDIFSYTQKSSFKIIENGSYKRKSVTFHEVAASTEYKNRVIGFSIKSSVHQRDSFNIIAMDIMKSIQIE